MLYLFLSMSKSADYFDRMEQRSKELRAPGESDYHADEVAEKTPYEQFGLTGDEAESRAAELLESNWDERFEEPWDALYHELCHDSRELERPESTESPQMPTDPTSPF